jgi:hypothetical protein
VNSLLLGAVVFFILVVAMVCGMIVRDRRQQEVPNFAFEISPGVLVDMHDVMVLVVIDRPERGA